MIVCEVNFDGLFGLIYYYVGFFFGNEVFIWYCYWVFNLQLVVKQGLKKMKVFVDVGYLQVVILLQECFNVLFLCQLGFSGSDEQVVVWVVQQELDLLLVVSLVLVMWVVNVVMVCFFVDLLDGLVYLMVVNLQDKFYCVSEVLIIEVLLQVIFFDCM